MTNIFYTNKKKTALFLGMGLIMLGFLCIFVLPLHAGAATNSGPGATTNSGAAGTNKIANPLTGVTDINSFVQTVLGILLKIGIPLLAFFIIFAGFQFVLAQGNAEKLEKAKRTLLYTIIGGALLLGSWLIATIIKTTVLAIIS